MIGGMIRHHAASIRGWLRGAALPALAIAVIAAPFFARASGPDPSGPDSTAPNPPAVAGLWMAESKKVAVELYSCEQNLCGKIVWLAKPYRKSGEFKRDDKNPDPALRNRGWCGIKVIEGLEAKDAKVWKNGRFYYPKQGKTFDIDIKLKNENRLELRAYLGIRLLGKSETWSRVGPNRALNCVPTPKSG